MGEVQYPQSLGPEWDILAAYLLKVKTTKSWRATHVSFSSWVAGLAKFLERRESTVWRALSAGRYYNELKEEYEERNVEIPELGSGKVVAPPECLELAAKISRVAPAEVVHKITQEVIDDKISRRELRNYWDTYRPILKGQTARGRNGDAPKFNPDDDDMVSNRVKANCIAGLIRQGSDWLGVEESYIYKVIPITKTLFERLDFINELGVIILYQPNTKQPLVIHAVEAISQPNNSSAIISYNSRGIGVDYFWIAVPSPPEPGDKVSEYEGLTPEIGILEAGPAGVTVRRRATPAKQNQGEALTVIRVLLAREITG